MDNFWNDETALELINFIGKYEHGWPSQRTILEHFKATKQPVKDWEILSFKDYKNEGEFYRQLSGGKWSNSFINERFSIDFLLNQNYHIHSVRRIDGEIFTVMDNVYYETEKDQYKFQIKSFYIKGNNMMASQHEGDTWGVNISILKKVKEPLPFPRFTAEEIIALKTFINSKLTFKLCL